MRRQITAMALSLALCGSLLSATALAAETPSGAADAAMAAAGVKDGQTVTQKELYAADPEGTVSFANLEARVRENNLTIRMLEESIASIDVVDYEKMYDELKDGLNEIAKIQRTMLQLGQLDSAMGNTSLSGSFSSEYIFSNLDASYTNFVKGALFKIKGVPVPRYVLFAIILTAIMWFIWNKTTFGKNMFALGSNEEAARVSGVNVFAVTIGVFALAGAMYGFTGFIEGARVASNTANTGLNYELDAIAACVIGGVSFVGGIGKIRGIVIGVLMLRLIFVGLLMVGVPQDLQYLIKGGIILFACALDMRNYLVKK